MKKIITILMTLMFSLALISCAKTTVNKTIYTKEFSYLPSQSEMTLESFQKPTKDKMGVATYVLKNKKAKDVLEAYEKQLTMDGWEITDDKKPASITAEKKDHKTIIVPAQNEKDVLLTVVSK